MKPLPGTWNPAEFNQPLIVRVDREGLMTYKTPVSDVLHGIGFHKGLHNPVTFELDVPEPTTFAVQVNGVSGFGDGRLLIRLDGKLVLDKNFPVPEGNKKEVLTEYNGDYTIKLPAGRHKVKVENTGKDWFSVATYKIPWLKTAKLVDDPLRASGVVGEGRALLWVQNRLHAWSLATANGYKPRAVKGAALNVLGLKPGRWTVEHWDTVRGAVTKAEEATVGEGGKLTISLPEITWDAAVRLRKRE